MNDDLSAASHAPTPRTIDPSTKNTKLNTDNSDLAMHDSQSHPISRESGPPPPSRRPPFLDVVDVDCRFDDAVLQGSKLMMLFVVRYWLFFGGSLHLDLFIPSPYKLSCTQSAALATNTLDAQPPVSEFLISSKASLIIPICERALFQPKRKKKARVNRSLFQTILSKKLQRNTRDVRSV